MVKAFNFITFGFKMKDFINKLYKNHSLIYKGLLFLSTTFLIVYLFPKSGKFKYNFEKGKPWQSESLQAPFNFAIKKTNDEIALEKKSIVSNAKLYFDIDNSIKEKVKYSYEITFKVVFSDTLPRYTNDKLFGVGQNIIRELYSYGVLNENYDFPDNKSIVILDGRENKKEGFYSSLIQQNDVKNVINSTLAKNNLSVYETEFVSLFFDLVEPNLVFNKPFTDKVIEDDLNQISFTRGSVAKETLIVSKGEVVEGDKYQVLKSLQSEYESQVWNESNYNWVLFAYTLLVALALLMLLLFLRKYRVKVFENNTKVTFIFFNISLMIFLSILLPINRSTCL